jgi:hypothetical protein
MYPQHNNNKKEGNLKLHISNLSTSELEEYFPISVIQCITLFTIKNIDKT